MEHRQHRREFLKNATFAAGTTLLVGAERGHTRPIAATQNGLRVRKSALQLPADDPTFAKYAAAVKAMHELPQTDGRNWWRQAKIHADHCVHGDPDFTAWHRHYLNQFEQICGELIKDPTFALPYWDWSYGRGKIPDAFFDIPELDVTHWNDPGVYSSPNWRNINTRGIRAIGKGVGVQDDPVRGGPFTSDSINRILRATSYGVFKNLLEGRPHNSGHVAVGIPAQGQAGHMGSGLSPLDPLFWLHHCNVDRLWAQWQLAGNETPEFGQKYNGNFVDRSGQTIDVTAEGSLDFEALGYTYQQFGGPGGPTGFLAAAGLLEGGQELIDSLRGRERVAVTPRVLGTAEPPAPVEIGVPTTIPVPVQGLLDALGETHPVLDASLPNLTMMAVGGRPDPDKLVQFGRPIRTRRRILCELTGVKAAFPLPPVVNVFVNCPYLEPSTPYTDIHYADTFAFFGPQEHGENHAQHGEGRTFLVDLTEAVERVNLANLENIKVQLMAVTAAGREEAGNFSVASVKVLSV